MSEKPCISIIIPVYNSEIYLEKCISSLLAQKLENIEFIFVDDGSNDNSCEIIQNFQKKDSRIKLFSQNHKKQGAARNFGLLQACGEYIGFVDSDDWADSSMFEKLYDKAKQTDSDITMCSFTMYNEKNSKLNEHDSYMSLDVFPSEFDEKVFSAKETFDFLFRICVSPCNKLYKKTFLDRLCAKFPENLYFEDNIFFLETFLRAEKISLIRDCCYFYRQFSKTSTCFSNEKSKIDMPKILYLQEKFLKKSGYYNILKNNFKIYKKKTLFYWYKKNDSKKMKFLYLLKIIVVNPLDFAVFVFNNLLKR